MVTVHARSALFDVYGDHLRSRGGRAPVAALVRLLAPLEVAPPAVRTAVSRMVKQGWLVADRPDGDSPGYALTLKALRRVDAAAARIYRTGSPGWDRTWHLVVVGRPPQRATRDRLRAGLLYLGYAPLAEGTWVAPRASAELPALLAAEGLRAHQFTARHDDGGAGDGDVLRRAWDLGALADAYDRWLADARVLTSSLGDAVPDEQAFAVRSRLVHGWRKFLFADPGLPRELLPPDWPGDRAAAFFDAQAARLAPAASRFVDSCLRPPVTSQRDAPVQGVSA